MRIIPLLLACFLDTHQARRVQRSEADYFTPNQRQYSQSLVQLFESISSPVEKLKNDFLAVLYKEPRWKNVASYVRIHGPLGNSLYGLEEAKWLTKLVRVARQNFIMRDFKIDFQEEHIIESAWKNGVMKKEHHQPGMELLAQWSMKFDTKKPWFSFESSEPVLLEGEVKFAFSQYGQLAVATVTNFFLNGFPVEWPNVVTSNDLPTNMHAIREWIEQVKALTGNEKKSGEFESVYHSGDLPFTADVDMSMKKLKSSFAHIFRQEPTWNILANNFTLTDHVGETLKGLEASQNLTKLMRNLHTIFAVRDFNVNFIEVSEMYSAFSKRGLQRKSQMPVPLFEDYDGSVLLATWNLKIGDRKGSRNSQLVIDGEMLFQLNPFDHELKIDRMQLRKIFVNGVPLQAWPEVDLTDDAAKSVAAIGEWVDVLKRSDKDSVHKF